MLGLAHQVRGQEFGIGAFIGHNEDLAWPGDHVDVHHAVELLFRRGHEDVARTHNLVHLGNGLGAVGQGRCRLGAAHQEHPVHTGHIGGSQNIGVRFPGAAGGVAMTISPTPAT